MTDQGSDDDVPKESINTLSVTEKNAKAVTLREERNLKRKSTMSDAIVDGERKQRHRNTQKTSDAKTSVDPPQEPTVKIPPYHVQLVADAAMKHSKRDGIFPKDPTVFVTEVALATMYRSLETEITRGIEEHPEFFGHDNIEEFVSVVQTFFEEVNPVAVTEFLQDAIETITTALEEAKERPPKHLRYAEIGCQHIKKVLKAALEDRRNRIPYEPGIEMTGDNWVILQPLWFPGRNDETRKLLKKLKLACVNAGIDASISSGYEGIVKEFEFREFPKGTIENIPRTEAEFKKHGYDFSL